MVKIFPYFRVKLYSFAFIFSIQKRVDDLQQRAKFEKYLDLLKGSIHPEKEVHYSSSATTTTSITTDYHSLNINSSHIAMENIEIQVMCVSKAMTLLNQMTALQNDQYTIKIVDYKRLRTSFPVSPFSNISNSCGKTASGRLRVNSLQSITLSPLSTNNLVSPSNHKSQMSSRKSLNSLSDDSTTENILSSNFRDEENFANHKNTLCDINSITSTNNGVFSFNGNHLVTRSDCHHRTATTNGGGGGGTNNNSVIEHNSIMNYTNDNSFNNLSAVTESTRIAPSHHDENNTDDDITVQTTMNTNDQTVVSAASNGGGGSGTVTEHQMNTKNKHFNNKRMDKREETSNWVKECDNEPAYFRLSSDETKLDVGNKLKVKVIPDSFYPTGFVCHKVDLLDAYAQMQYAMDYFYEKQHHQHESEECQSMAGIFADSLESDKSSFCNEHFFKGLVFIDIF